MDNILKELRHSPDFLVIGEARNAEEFEMMMKAAGSSKRVVPSSLGTTDSVPADFVKKIMK